MYEKIVSGIVDSGMIYTGNPNKWTTVPLDGRYAIDTVTSPYVTGATENIIEVTHFDLLKRIIHLKQIGSITLEKAFNMQLMVISKDEENHTLVLELVKTLENEMIKL